MPLPSSIYTIPTQQDPLPSALGTGLADALSGLAQQRAQQLSRRQQASGLQALLGLEPEQAQQAAYAPESVLKEFTKRKLLEPSQQAYLQQIQQMFGTGVPSEGAPGLSPDLAKAGLTEQQATKLVELGMKQQTEKSRQQRHIENLAAPKFKAIEEKAVPARSTVKLAKEALDIIKTRKPVTGVLGRITPEYLQTDEGQELVSKLKQIVLTRAQLGKGVPTRMRLILEEGAKAQIWQQPKVIESILKSTMEDPEINLDIAKDQARQEILEKYDTLPKNWETLVNKRTNEIVKANKPLDKIGENVFSELPPADKFEGKIAKNPATGQRMKSVNGKWIPVEE